MIPGLLSEKPECYLCALLPGKLFLSLNTKGPRFDSRLNDAQSCEQTKV